MTQKNEELATESNENQLPLNYDDFSQREVRSLTFHLLYAMEGFDYNVPLETIIENFNEGYDLNIPLDSQVFYVANEVIQKREELDETIKPLLHNWRFERIGVITKLILRLALWELHNTDTPPTVVINEAIELAKCFAEQDAYKFINGLLDEQLKRMEIEQ